MTVIKTARTGVSHNWYNNCRSKKEDQRVANIGKKITVNVWE